MPLAWNVPVQTNIEYSNVTLLLSSFMFGEFHRVASAFILHNILSPTSQTISCFLKNAFHTKFFLYCLNYFFKKIVFIEFVDCIILIYELFKLCLIINYKFLTIFLSFFYTLTFIFKIVQNLDRSSQEDNLKYKIPLLCSF